MHRLDLNLFSHRKELKAMELEPVLTLREKFPLLEAQRRVEHAMLQYAGQQTQHTTD